MMAREAATAGFRSRRVLLSLDSDEEASASAQIDYPVEFKPKAELNLKGNETNAVGPRPGLAVIETGRMRIAVARSGEAWPRSRAEAIGARKPQRPRA
ncbi:MAG: hypothetical protein WAV18_32925 [Roseiarcus sp.]